MSGKDVVNYSNEDFFHSIEKKMVIAMNGKDGIVAIGAKINEIRI